MIMKSHKLSCALSRTPMDPNKPGIVLRIVKTRGPTEEEQEAEFQRPCHARARRHFILAISRF